MERKEVRVDKECVSDAKHGEEDCPAQNMSEAAGLDALQEIARVTYTADIWQLLNGHGHQSQQARHEDGRCSGEHDVTRLVPQARYRSPAGAGSDQAED